jgi:uncharacterized protein YbjT (DUF2867 family)
MSGNKIAVFPASGGLGGGTYNRLVEVVDPKDVILIARYPEKIDPKLKERGVTIRTADYDKPETLEHAFDGVSYLMLISYPSPAHHHRSKVGDTNSFTPLQSKLTVIEIRLINSLSMPHAGAAYLISHTARSLSEVTAHQTHPPS